MAVCFVIQPFNEKFDKRFDDVFKPAIEAAGLEAYRVDQDPSVSVPIESIEDGIRKASLCLADITEDNPNIWYELGYAFALNRPIIMVCSEERTGKKYPFDIQHRKVISYKTESPSDFDKFRTILGTNIKAKFEQDTERGKISEPDRVASIEGLSPHEVLVLAVLVGEVYSSTDCVSVNSARREAERSGLTPVGFRIAVRKLIAKAFLIESEKTQDYYGNEYTGLQIQEKGWNWIESNESQFVLHKAVNRNQVDPDHIPF